MMMLKFRFIYKALIAPVVVSIVVASCTTASSSSSSPTVFINSGNANKHKACEASRHMNWKGEDIASEHIQPVPLDFQETALAYLGKRTFVEYNSKMDVGLSPLNKTKYQYSYLVKLCLHGDMETARSYGFEKWLGIHIIEWAYVAESERLMTENSALTYYPDIKVPIVFLLSYDQKISNHTMLSHSMR